MVRGDEQSVTNEDKLFQARGPVSCFVWTCINGKHTQIQITSTNWPGTIAHTASLWRHTRSVD